MPESSPSVGFQITSDPDTTSVAAPRAGDAREREPGGAFRLVLVADLDPQAPPVDDGPPAQTHAVDAASLPEVMRAMAPRLEVSVPDHLGDPAARRTVAFTADALDAFTPGGLVARIPALAALAGVRAALDDARQGRVGLDALRERLRDTGVDGAEGFADAVASGPGAPASTDDGALGRLLGMVSVPGAPPSPGTVDALARAAAGPGTGLDADAAARVVAGLDARLGAQALAVLDHPDVRRAEAAWRGVRFLCDRLAFRRGARLDLLPATRATLDEALHFGVLLPEHAEGAGRVPLAAVIVDHAFEATSADLAALADLAGTGASLQVPVVASAAPAFFGLATPTDLARLPPVRTLLDQQAYAAFRSLRARPEAAFLALAVPPFVLRAPFGPSNPDRALPVEGGETVWGGAALLAAAAMAARHAAVGWPTLGAGTTVGDLPVRTTRMGALPLSAAFSESVLQDLGRAGFLSFSGPLQTDRAVVGPPATTALPTGASADGSAQVSLSAAVFTALAAHRALGIGAGLAGSDPDAALAEIDARFRAFLRTPAGAPPEDAVTVQRLDEHETETSHTYGVRLRPPDPILSLPVGVVFGVEVPKEAVADGG